ncbi:MAG: hypothetical protein R3293_20360 [Candidatus Promineifilaceae bacterium]|nr:hypothetical protein [Candidatus Promineifilaceae bacterium]
MAHKLNPFATELRVPTLSATIMQSVAINSTYRIKQARIEADLLIQLDTSGTSILQWDAYMDMINLGYETAKPLIEDWLQKE